MLHGMDRLIPVVVTWTECHLPPGDSGGPLMRMNPPRLVGVTSFGKTILCGRYRDPEVYTRLSIFADWVQTVGEGESEYMSINSESFTEEVRKQCEGKFYDWKCCGHIFKYYIII